MCPARRPTMVGNRHQRFISQILQSLGVFVKNLTRWSQFHRFAGTVQQAVAVLLLQLADLCADGGL